MRSVIKYISEVAPFLQAPIVGSPKDFPRTPESWIKSLKTDIKTEKYPDRRKKKKKNTWGA